jgi:hypothetical protein
MSATPLAREQGLVVDSIGDELLVYDTSCGRAHSLNVAAAAVWRACDGQRNIDQLAEFTGCDRNAVELALNNLLDVELISGYETSGISRRVVLRRLSLTAAGLAVGLPVIRSITAPTAAMAVSGGCTSNSCPRGDYCASNGSCRASGVEFPLDPGSGCQPGAGFCASTHPCMPASSMSVSSCSCCGGGACRGC